MSQYTPYILVHRETEYEFSCSETLFEPKNIGLRPTGFSTGCWSGWHPTYSISEGRLYLQDLTIYTDINLLPVICRVAPVQNFSGCCKYGKLFLPLGHSGDLTLTKYYSGRFGLAAIDDTEQIPSFRLMFDTGQLVEVENLSFVRKTDPTLDWPESVIRVPVAQGEPTPFDGECIDLPEATNRR